jgi:hypothetical protein
VARLARGHGLDEPLALEAREGGVDRAEGDVGPDPEAIAQLGADLVAVVVALHEQSQDRDV